MSKHILRFYWTGISSKRQYSCVYCTKHIEHVIYDINTNDVITKIKDLWWKNFIMFRVIFVLCFMNMYNTEVCRFRIVTNTFECNNRCLYNKLCCIIKTNEHVWILMLLDSIKTKKWNNNEILMQCCYCHLFWVDTAWITSSYNIYRYGLRYQYSYSWIVSVWCF